jgi:copper chaperone CopZ
MIEMNVPDMTCAKCAENIRRAVGQVDSGASCEVDLDAKRVRVQSALPPSDFVEALEEVGYSPNLLSAIG